MRRHSRFRRPVGVLIAIAGSAIMIRVVPITVWYIVLVLLLAALFVYVRM